VIIDVFFSDANITKILISLVFISCCVQQIKKATRRWLFYKRNVHLVNIHNLVNKSELGVFLFVLTDSCGYKTRCIKPVPIGVP